MTNGSGLASVDHVVVLMLENRSFDHMLGFLYPGNVSPSGQSCDGLTGTESNPGSDGKPVTVFRIEPVSAGPGPAAGTVSHLESIRAELISRRYPAGVTAPPPPGPLSA
jgi:phospholipase C